MADMTNLAGAMRLVVPIPVVVGYDLYAQYKYRENQRYGYQTKAKAFRHAGNSHEPQNILP